MADIPAFPSSYGDERNPGWIGGGMTLRDWFAGQALIGLASQHHGNDWGQNGIGHGQACARKSYAIADAMLAAREGVAK